MNPARHAAYPGHEPRGSSCGAGRGTCAGHGASLRGRPSPAAPRPPRRPGRGCRRTSRSPAPPPRRPGRAGPPAPRPRRHRPRRATGPGRTARTGRRGYPFRPVGEHQLLGLGVPGGQVLPTHPPPRSEQRRHVRRRRRGRAPARRRRRLPPAPRRAAGHRMRPCRCRAGCTRWRTRPRRWPSRGAPPAPRGTRAWSGVWPTYTRSPTATGPGPALGRWSSAPGRGSSPAGTSRRPWPAPAPPGRVRRGTRPSGPSPAAWTRAGRPEPWPGCRARFLPQGAVPGVDHVTADERLLRQVGGAVQAQRPAQGLREPVRPLLPGHPGYHYRPSSP